MQTVDISQWHDRTEEPVIVWVYAGVWELFPAAVDDTHDTDLYTEYARAFYAVGAYQTWEELTENASWYGLTPDQIEELYSRGDYSADRAGLPAEWVAEGVNDDGSDESIYTDYDVMMNSRRESLSAAAPKMYPEDVEEIREEIAAARAEYDC